MRFRRFVVSITEAWARCKKNSFLRMWPYHVFIVVVFCFQKCSWFLFWQILHTVTSSKRTISRKLTVNGEVEKQILTHGCFRWTPSYLSPRVISAIYTKEQLYPRFPPDMLPPETRMPSPVFDQLINILHMTKCSRLSWSFFKQNYASFHMFMRAPLQH